MTPEPVTTENALKICRWLENAKDNSCIRRSKTNQREFYADGKVSFHDALTLNELAALLPTSPEPMIPVAKVREMLWEAGEYADRDTSNPGASISMLTLARFRSKLDAYQP